MSLSFTGSDSPYSYLSISNSPSLYLGTNDYTIQWWQYQTDTNPFPRIFQIGDYYSQIILGVSIEGGGGSYTFYYWNDSSPIPAFSVTSSQTKNKWVHFAITRTSSTLRIFMNGVLKYSGYNNQDITGFYDNMSIAQESNPTTTTGAGFGGYIYGFEMCDISKYTTDTTFTPSTDLPPVTGNTILLLSGGVYDGLLGFTAIEINSSTVADVPSNSGGDGGTGATGGTGMSSEIPLCFLEGTKILIREEGKDVYKPIEELKAGDEVWTYVWGYIPIARNGYLWLDYRKNNPEKGKRLYVYSKNKLKNGLREDLVLTGYHSILVPFFTDKQREDTRALFGKLYITDKLARLAACLDERTELYEIEGRHKVYHLALENEDYYTNYGVLANGVLTETTSLRMFEEGGFTVCSEAKNWREKVKNNPSKMEQEGGYSKESEWL